MTTRTRLTPRLSLSSLIPVVLGAFLLVPSSAAATERLCDTSFENCRTPLLQLIENETVGIDAAWWFMTDVRYTRALIDRWQQGVPVRVIIDPRANPTYPANADRLRELRDAGIPMRQKTSSGILHWKMMLFAGQGTVQFSAANYSDQAFVPRAPYENYVDEVIYFTGDPSVVNSFKTRFDDLWTRTSGYSNYANVSGPLLRRYATFEIDPELNFAPAQSFRSRSVARYNAETQQIDAIMFRITDRAHTDAIIAALGRGVRVRLITDYGQYTWTERYWHAWNVDRLLTAGAEVRVAGDRMDRFGGPSLLGHLGTVHQKSTVLHSQGMTIFGSSNWTSPSSDSQEEHNYFTRKPFFYQFFYNQFERKWNNSNPIGAVETAPLVPMPPDAQNNVSPVSFATGQSPSSTTLRWHSGYWTHVYDIYVGTTADPPLLVADREMGPSTHATDYKSLTLTGLQPGTTYYWRVVGKTMAGVARSGPIWSFTTSGTAPPPPSSGGLPDGWGGQDIGFVGAAGSASESNGTFTVRGSGEDIWANADAFHFAYRTLSGDGTIVARVATLQNTDRWAKSGVMIRETLAPGSKHASMFVSSSRGLAFQRRVSTNGISTHTAGASATAPHWVKMERSGNTFRAYTSATGTNWTLVGTDTITMGATVYVGLALTSHNDGVLAASTIDSVAVTSGAPAPPPSSGLPDGWTSRDIGTTGAVGSASHSNGTFSVLGSGADIWDTADAFHFTSTAMTGDGAITARVATQQNTHHWAKSGVMIREALTPGSKHAAMFVSPARGLAFQRRASTNGSSAHTAGANHTAPYWVRLERSGNTFRAFTSPDGTTWTLVGTDTIAMASTVHVGLAVTSHHHGVIATSTFNNVSLGAVSPPPTLSSNWSSLDVGSVGQAGTAAHSDGTFTVEASGADIWDTADEFHFVHRTLTGDGEIRARVGSLSATHHWAKAGVMIRDSLTAASAHAMMLVSRDRGLAFQRRVTAGGESTHTDAGAGTVPKWVRLVRTGDNVFAYRSPDGVNWMLVGADTIPMDTTVHVGLALTNHDNSARARATFSDVSLGG